MTWLPHSAVQTETYGGFAPVRPYVLPLSPDVLALPFRPLWPRDERWDDEETPLASEVQSCR